MEGAADAPAAELDVQVSDADKAEAEALKDKANKLFQGAHAHSGPGLALSCTSEPVKRPHVTPGSAGRQAGHQRQPGLSIYARKSTMKCLQVPAHGSAVLATGRVKGTRADSGRVVLRTAKGRPTAGWTMEFSLLPL